MKPLLVLIRIMFVGVFWSIFFLEGIRVIMLTNWRFDIFNSEHWYHAWNLWLNGWTIKDSKEWAFVLIILTFIPLWLTGWAALSLIRWGEIFTKIALFPVKLFRSFFYKPVKIIANKSGKGVKKKKSYKEVRPRGIRAPMTERTDNVLPAPTISGSLPTQASRKAAAPAASIPIAPAAPKAFDHSLFQFDSTEDDFDFNFDAFDTTPVQEKPRETSSKNEDSRSEGRKDNRKDNRNAKDNNRNNRDNSRDRKNAPAKPENAPAQASHGGGSVLDIIKQKGYEVITGATIKNNLIDFIGVADKQICLCLLDKEPGDWLADEERFNDEEPLWFSESSHRISPVRKVDVARRILEDKLKEADFSLTVKPYVIIQLGNIINAEDMFEIWDGMAVNVTRIDRGTPKELRLFPKSLEEADNHIDKEKFEKIKKLIRNIV